MGVTKFGSTIKRRRDALGISQSRLADLVGRSTSTIRNWEKDSASPSDPADVVALAAVLGVPEPELLEAAGFEPSIVESAPTLEESFASLTSETAIAKPSSDPDPDPDPDPEPEPDSPTTETPDLRENLGSEGGGHESDDDEPEPLVDSDESTDEDLEPEPLTTAERVRGRRLFRAAPPTVLEATPIGEASYMEEESERQRYRIRSMITAMVVIALVFVLMWSFGRTTDAISSMWDEFIGMLSI